MFLSLAKWSCNFIGALNRSGMHDPGNKKLSYKEEKDMKKVIDQICTKLAACAFLAAVVATGTASHMGMYEPKMPEELKR